MVVSQSFETFMGVVIFVNLMSLGATGGRLMIVETNSDAACFPEYAERLEECLQHVESDRLLDRRDWLGWRGPFVFREPESFPLICTRILRVLRLVRVGRLVISVPELYILLSGLTTSVKPIIFGSMMLISVILVWSIIVVELLHPIASGILGERQNTQAVEKAAEARENDQERKQKQADEKRQKAPERRLRCFGSNWLVDMVELALLCDRMDNDGSGALSLQEMLYGFPVQHQLPAGCVVVDLVVL
eukprot:Skav207010  [mRNA]  locus=scaffold1554:187856:191342:- [translate_table: standard]